jgi:hypothetical protein
MGLSALLDPVPKKHYWRRTVGFGNLWPPASLRAQQFGPIAVRRNLRAARHLAAAQPDRPMPRMLLRLIPMFVAAMLWLNSAPVAAKFGEFTGDDYFQHCTSTDPNWKPQSKSEQEMTMYCWGYIDAAITLIILMDGRSFCLPTGSTPQDVLKATIAFLQAHSDQKQYLLASSIVAAVQAQWPCPSK